MFRGHRHLASALLLKEKVCLDFNCWSFYFNFSLSLHELWVFSAYKLQPPYIALHKLYITSSPPRSKSNKKNGSVYYCPRYFSNVQLLIVLSGFFGFSKLFQPSASFCDTMREVFDHMDLAHDSLCEDLYPEDETGMRSVSYREKWNDANSVKSK